MNFHPNRLSELKILAPFPTSTLVFERSIMAVAYFATTLSDYYEAESRAKCVPATNLNSQ